MGALEGEVGCEYGEGDSTVREECANTTNMPTTRECNTHSTQLQASHHTVTHITGKFNQVVKDTQAPLFLRCRSTVLL